MRKFRTYSEVDHATGSELLEQVLDQRERLARRLAGVGCLVAVASGKGGVGKSAVTANLATVLAGRGHRVGVVDADLHGPSLARMLGVIGRSLEDREGGIVPPRGAAGVAVVSMELLQDAEDAPLRWRDPGTDTFLWQSAMDTTTLREFLTDVAWEGTDFLLVDVPPGTDKIQRLLELVPRLPLALLVTTPSEMARAVVARSVRLVREGGVGSVALVANMTGYLCPDCGSLKPLFRGDGAARLAAETGLPIWGEIPFDPRLGESTDAGRPLMMDESEGPLVRAFCTLADRVEEAAAAAASETSNAAEPEVDR